MRPSHGVHATERRIPLRDVLRCGIFDRPMSARGSQPELPSDGLMSALASCGHNAPANRSSFRRDIVRLPPMFACASRGHTCAVERATGLQQPHAGETPGTILASSLRSRNRWQAGGCKWQCSAGRRYVVIRVGDLMQKNPALDARSGVLDSGPFAFEQS